jgi:hypothetical protein
LAFWPACIRAGRGCAAGLCRHFYVVADYDAFPDADGHAHADPHPFSHGDFYSYPDSYPDRHGDSDAHAHADGHAHLDAYADPDAHADAALAHARWHLPHGARAHSDVPSHLRIAAGL